MLPYEDIDKAPNKIFAAFNLVNTPRSYLINEYHKILEYHSLQGISISCVFYILSVLIGNTDLVANNLQGPILYSVGAGIRWGHMKDFTNFQKSGMIII